MQFSIPTKKALLLVCLIMPIIWCRAHNTYTEDGYSHILIKEKNVQGTPKGSTIQASIDRHLLVVAFLENLGQQLQIIAPGNIIITDFMWIMAILFL